MLLWIILAFLTAAVAALLVFPLVRTAAPVTDTLEGEAAVYRDQLAELERDKATGLIGEEEAEYARAEIGRRLIATAEKVERAAGYGKAKGVPTRRRMPLAAVGVTLVVPAIGLCLYVALGSPWLPAQPLAARLENPGNDLNLLIARAERHLAQDPSDGAGWDLLAPIYFRTQRLGDAEMAYRNAIRLLGESAPRLAGLGETLVAANDGIVVEDARNAFQTAIRLKPDDARVRFYLALALEQAGRQDEARQAFEALARDTPPGAPWLALVNEHIAKTGGTVPSRDVAGRDVAGAGRAPGNPTDADVATIGAMAAPDRQAAIRGMVDTLAARLEEEPNNIEGWLRLVRSYAVLGERQKAAEALETGLKTFAPTTGEGRQLVALGTEMGVAPANSAGEGARP
ncbi:c-type cytochrome biogenesis protein CcmI [Neorhizobium sp. NPDC001467]|uniref:c-type cytochrome biogenesis protein CcmI n=1 Tax=Neorhizobium sp. NPDC001467 TaxID=3390595 RepID=UPI003CFFD167